MFPTTDVARLSLRRRRGGPKLMSVRSPEAQKLAPLSLCTGRGNGRNPIILEGFFELVLNIIRVVDELHEHVVIAGAAATGQVGIVLARIVGELLVVARAAAAGDARIVLSRIVGELLVVADAAGGEVRIVLPRIVSVSLVVADAAAAGEAWVVLSRIVGVGGDNATEGLTFGYVELVA